MRITPRAAIAELVGTFAFFTIGAGAVVMTVVTRGQVSLLGVAAAHGLVLAVMVSAFGHISGGQFNPAVTFGLWLGRRLDAIGALTVIVAQLVGALAAGFLLKAIFTKAQWSPTHLGTPALGTGVSPAKGVLIEAVLTFILLIAVWGTAVDPKGAKVGGFAIGMAVFVDILLGGPLTGAAMNPARWFGPAVASGYFTNAWVYWAGPLIGAAAASLLYRAALLDA